MAADQFEPQTRADIICPDEIQIEGMLAYPLIDGKAFSGIAWYKIDPVKVTIGFDAGPAEEETREYDIKRLTLSGFQVGQFSIERRAVDELLRSDKREEVK